MLITTSQPSMAASGVCLPSAAFQPKGIASERQTTPINALVIGPAMPIQNSVLASDASFSICATPPSANKVIDFTGKPRSLAIAACDNSCTTMAAKKSIAVSIGVHQVSSNSAAGHFDD